MTRQVAFLSGFHRVGMTAMLARRRRATIAGFVNSAKLRAFTSSTNPVSALGEVGVFQRTIAEVVLAQNIARVCGLQHR